MARFRGWDHGLQYSQQGPSLSNLGIPLTGAQSWLSGQAAVRPGKCQPLRASRCDVWERRDVFEVLNEAGSGDYMWGGGTDWPEAPGEGLVTTL